MELTIEQALQQGVAAHKEGKLQEAERLYLAILQVQPAHPDANHNLGILAVSVNKAELALPLFKLALEANPKIEQFWLSYISALIREKQFENAKQVLEQAKKQELSGENLHFIDAQINQNMGRLEEAEASYKKSIELKPDFAEAHSNLGVVLYGLGKLDEAEASLRQAIALKPDYAEAHSNLGLMLQELGRLGEAIASLNKAIALKSDYVEAHHNLGVTLTSFKAKSFSSQLEKSYLNLLNLETVVRPDLISHSVISLLKHHNTVKEAISCTKKNDIKNSVCELCIRLSNIPLFLKIIELCPIADLEIESLLKNLRKILLLERQSLSNNHKLLRFQSSLALPCFTNEFIYEETEEETLAVKALETVLQ